MSTKSIISSSELSRQIRSGFVDQSFEVVLVDAPGITYEPSVTDDVAFLANSVTPGTFGYDPQVIRFEQTDETNYSDGGVALDTKTAVFTNDGAGSFQFTHVVLMRGQGNVVTLGSATGKPSEGVNSTTTDLPTLVAGNSSAQGLTVDLTVTNDGANLGDWVAVPSSAGFGYAVGDVIQVSEATLLTVGATTNASLGSLDFEVTEVSVSDGSIVSVTPTENTVIMDNGNEAVFYFNIKQFGYASQV